MELDATFLEILRCPVTGSKLTPLSDQQLELLNRAIGSGEVKMRDGSPVRQPIEGGLINADESLVLAIYDDIIDAIQDELLQVPQGLFSQKAK